MMTDNNITILGSGIALGVYIPALRLRDLLKSKGYAVQVIILEQLFGSDVLKKLDINKKMFHNNFRIAEKAHQIAGDMSAYCVDELKEKLFLTWKKEKIRKFIVFSGYWMPLIDDFSKVNKLELIVDCIHMDAVMSNSWKGQKELLGNANQIWPFDFDNNLVSSFIPYNNKISCASEGQGQLVLHGGGWGMGLLKDAYVQVSKKDYNIFRVAYNNDEYEQFLNETDNVYYMDACWKPWENLKYPPIYKGRSESSLDEMLAENIAIISKPGGGTLMDSISLGKPIVFLSPLSDYEKKNAELWERLRFGISLEKWRETGYSMNILQEMKNNLLDYRLKLKGIDEFLCSLKQV